MLGGFESGRCYGTGAGRVSDDNQLEAMGAERRLVFRFLSYWRDLSEHGRTPLMDAIRPEDIPDIWPYCLVAELGSYRDDPMIRYCGTSYERPPGEMLAHTRLSTVPPRCLAAMVVNLHQEVISRRVAVSRGGKLTTSRGEVMLYRAILMPISREGVNVDFLIGAASYRPGTM